MEFTKEQLEKAMAANNPAELLAVAKAEQIPLTEEDATQYFASLHPQTGKIADEELDNVVGGGCGHMSLCPVCGSEKVGIIPKTNCVTKCFNCGYDSFRDGF